MLSKDKGATCVAAFLGDFFSATAVVEKKGESRYVGDIRN